MSRDRHRILRSIADDFEQLARHFEQSIEALAQSEDGKVQATKLRRANQAAKRGVDSVMTALAAPPAADW
jgi:uncharacterized membrane-anchored protein YhcB (DUF1043 family)